MTSDYMVLDVDASAMELRPLSHGERVGVRGYGLSIGPNPSPGLLRNPTSPYGRGESARRTVQYHNRTLAFANETDDVLCRLHGFSGDGARAVGAVDQYRIDVTGVSY